VVTEGTLQTRPFGSTGHTVTALGLGGAPLNESCFNDGVATIRHGLDAGLSYFDTSPLYGQGMSQAIYGTALTEQDQGFLFATKLGHFRDPRIYRSVDGLRAQLHENLRLLRRDRVDLLQVHEADFHAWWSDDGASGRLRQDEDYDFAAAPVVRVLREAQERGDCRYIGISGNSAPEMARVLAALDVDTCLIAFSYDLIWRGARAQVLPLAQDKGTALILGAIFQYGRFTQVRRDWLAEPPEWMTDDVRDRFVRLYAIQAESAMSLVELTVRFLLADPGFATMLIGAATPAQLEESVAAARLGPLPDDLQAQIEALGIG
jgi:aryl-alcohol dehydrogenase-like predicted oxidoreductase